jgi:hypothetical protein
MAILAATGVGRANGVASTTTAIPARQNGRSGGSSWNRSWWSSGRARPQVSRLAADGVAY